MLSKSKVNSHHQNHLNDCLAYISWQIDDIDKFCKSIQKLHSSHSSYHFTLNNLGYQSNDYHLHNDQVQYWQTVINGHQLVRDELNKIRKPTI